MIAIILALAAANMSGRSVVEAEHAYAEMAQSKGQWTAFRATAAPDAVMFVPDPQNALKWLDGRKDPTEAIKWQPSAAYVSCDGRTAATLGPWQLKDSVGYFSTIWSRTGGSWQWKVDFGDGLKTALPASPAKVPIRRASCRRADPGLLPKLDAAKQTGAGSSEDQSLHWIWRVEADGAARLIVYLWTGRAYEAVIDKKVSA